MLIKKNLIIALLTFSFLLSNYASAETLLRIASWLPPTHPQNAYVIPTWAEWVKKATEGRVTVKVEYGIGHPKTLFDLVEDGVVDASWSFHGYVPGRFKLTQIVEQPLLGASAEAASVAHWRVHQKYLSATDEHEGLELLALFTHGPGQIHLAKPISSLADLEGKKIRLGGVVQGELGHRLKVTPVGAPAPKVYEMMQQGVIDGVFIPMAEQKTLRLKEVARNVIAFPDGMYLGSFSMFIDPEFMESLSAQDRQAIRSVSGEKLSALAGKAWESGDAEGLQAAKDAGVDILELSAKDTMTQEYVAITRGMEQNWIDSVTDRQVDAAAALAELKNIARNYK